MRKEICFTETDILLPQNCDMSKWAVIACDQYTADAEYWSQVEKCTEGDKSSYNIIFPEIYLETENETQKDARIKDICANMEDYEKSNVFRKYEKTMFFLERRLRNGKIRRGIIGAVDLLQYDYSENSNANIRATEQTVTERLPPRIKIRENALYELPHIMILYNDKKGDIIDRLTVEKGNLEKVYDFSLMNASGNATAYNLTPELIDYVKSEIIALSDKNRGEPIFAVGDGNHSLATAKECCEALRGKLSEEELSSHPARYALCEIVNIYDESLEFEPIYRIVFDVDLTKLKTALSAEFDITYGSPRGESFHRYEFYAGGNREELYINNPKYSLPVKELQTFLDKYLTLNRGKIDYIHGISDTVKLSEKPNAAAFIFDTMRKDELFASIKNDGVLPRKTFSMGEAYDKRFYIEARRIKM